MNTLSPFLESLKTSLINDTFIQLRLGDYKGEEAELKKIIVKRVLIKKKDHLSFVYRYKRRDLTKNHPVETAFQELEKVINLTAFCFAQLLTTIEDVSLQAKKSNLFLIKKTAPSHTEVPSREHDQPKQRKIESAEKHYLYALGITDSTGKVRPKGRDKFKQINHYIELLSSLLKELPSDKKLHIVDMGSGKGYLSFALFDYLKNILKLDVQLTGVEFRNDLVDLCNKIAKESKFTDLQFVQNTIENYQTNKKIDVLIALHACDTATDDAIYKGLTHKADLIITAPCCHKQIRKEIAQNKPTNEMSSILSHGIFMERQAEMVTDNLRALYLERANYSTKVFEFIDTEHTPKNILITAQRNDKKTVRSQEKIQKDIDNTKSLFGIRKHHLEVLIENS